MILNGFNSDDYRYFRHINGNVFKYRNDQLASALFNHRFLPYISPKNFCIKDYPKDKPFNLTELIKMQDKVVFESDGSFTLNFEKGDYAIITDFLYSKLHSDEVLFNYLFLGEVKTIGMENEEKLSMIDEDENIDLSILDQLQSSSLTVPGTLNNLLTIKSKIRHIWKFNRGITFKIPYKKGEVWNLTNPEVALCFVNQSFINCMVNSSEILDEEKLKLFEAEYKDNIPNKKIRYYKLKDSVFFTESWHICNPCVLRDIKSKDFDCIPANCLRLCESNPNNYNPDGSIKYIGVEFYDGSGDIALESQALQIANRLSQSDAIERYEDDLKAYELDRRKKEAEEYVKKNKSRYNKGQNRFMTPFEFMEHEEKKERAYLGKRLVKALNNRIDSMK